MARPEQGSRWPRTPRPGRPGWPRRLLTLSLLRRSSLARVLAAASSFVPGVGQILLGRHARGITLFMLFATTLNGALLNLLLDDRSELRPYVSLLVGFAGLLWLVSFIDVVASLLFLRTLAPENRRSLFLLAASHYLKGELEPARAILVRLLRRDPSDIAAGLQLAAVHARAGRLQKARRLLRRCHRKDRGRTWEYEILSRLESLGRRATSPPSSSRQAPGDEPPSPSSQSSTSLSPSPKTIS